MNRDPRGYYAALHVTPDSTPAEIQRAFRALMRRRHPDVDPSAGAVTAAGDSGAGDEVRRILESFAVLRDPKARAEYDPAGGAAGQGSTSAGSAVTGSAATGSREIPVRHHRSGLPVLRVTPVRWEQEPW